MNSIMELQQLIDALKSNVQKDDVDLFQNQLLNIKDQFQDNAPVASIIKMLQSIGKYLASQQENAHKDAVLALEFIAMQLEKIIQYPDTKRGPVDEILSNCVRHFSDLKKTITSGPEISDIEIQDLKSVIFAIDWEISDTTLQSLNEVVTRLMVKFKYHKIPYTFLKIINNVGQYIASKKADAHVDSIPFLHSVFDHFEEIVQNQGMPLDEKKELLKGDIIRFQKFGQKPASPNKISPRDEDEDEDEDNFVQPALSHIVSSPIQVSDDIPALSLISEDESQLVEKSQASEVITPALVGKKEIPPEPRDVMDDLFTVKKTSADDLLDAIHLGNDNAMAELSNADSEAQGVKKITPRRMDNEPIPEIGNRLDKFFNLEDSPEDENEDGVALPEVEQIPGPADSDEGSVPFHMKNGFEDDNGVALSEEEQTLDSDNSDEGIIPFQYEDEMIEDVSGHIDSSQGVMERLKNTLKNPINCLEDERVQKVNEDLSLLETLWEGDLDKLFLLDTISCLVQFINQPSEPELTAIEATALESTIPGPTDPEPIDPEPIDPEPIDPDGMAMETPPPTPPVSEDSPKGVWQRIKSIFLN